MAPLAACCSASSCSREEAPPPLPFAPLDAASAAVIRTQQQQQQQQQQQSSSSLSCQQGRISHCVLTAVHQAAKRHGMPHAISSTVCQCRRLTLFGHAHKLTPHARPLVRQRLQQAGVAAAGECEHGKLGMQAAIGCEQAGSSHASTLLFVGPPLRCPHAQPQPRTLRV